MKVKIGELAKMTGCQVVTIRYYEKEGLLKRPERTERNYRLYGDEDIARLRFIRHCRQHGMSLDEIRTLLVYSDHPTGSCDWINRLIRTHIEAVEQQIRDLEHLRAHLESLYHKCDGSREGGCGILKSLIDGENCQYCQARQQRTGQVSITPHIQADGDQGEHGEEGIKAAPSCVYRDVRPSARPWGRAPRPRS